MESLPKQGEFVVVWNYGDALYTNLYKWFDGKLYAFNERYNYWEEAL